MPELNYGATFLESNVDTIVPQSWENDVLPPFQKIRTLLNTTGLDYQNVQDNGIRYTGIRTHDAIEAVRYKVRNNTGGSLAKGDLVYFTGTYSDGTDSYPTVAKAISTTAAATNFFAQGVCTAAISDSADGTVAVFLELTNINTSGGTVGDPVYLNTSAGGWTRTRPTGGQYVQVVGTISVVHASTGRVIFSLGALPEFLKGGSSGLDAELETLTLTDALILGDDKAVHFGASTDYSIQYDSGNTQWELVSTNIDGSGTNGVVLLVEDGTNDVSLAGGLSTDALSTPTAGLTTTAVTAVSLDISGDVDIDGTLEADAITLGGTALGSLYSPIAGSSSIVTVGTIGTGTWGATDVAVAHGGTGASSAADARTNLGLVIGTNVQAYDAGLNSIAGLTTAADKMIYTSGSDTYAVADLSSFARTILDDADAAAVRTTIGAQASGTYSTLAYKTISVSGQDNVVADAADDTLTFAAGTGITLTTNATSDTVTITNSATGANAFGTIAVSGQDDVVADSTDDTLTLAAGTGITLTTNAGSDTVTITGTASPVTALNNATADELVTVGSTTTELDAEANLPFDGTTLVNTGQGIGVGEAPSTWASGFDFVQIGGTLALASQPGVQASQAAYIVQNAHYDDSDGSGAWEYQATDEAHRIGMSSGNITFDNAASGTAGNDITWSERMRINSSGNVGIGTTSPGTLIHAEGSTGYLKFDPSVGGDTKIQVTSNSGNVQFGTFNASHLNLYTNSTERMRINSSGNVSISGALSKGSGSFRIDHPLSEKTDTHHLVHSFVEAPQADLIYRGTATLSSGTAEINLDTAARMTDGTFVALNTNVQAFTSNESGWDAVRGSVSGNVLTIASTDDTSTATVSWMVVGERKDQHMIDTDWTDSEGRVITEPEKPVVEAA